MDSQLPPAPPPTAPPPPTVPPPGAAAALPPVPLEDPSTGFFRGLWETVVLFVTRPDEGFRRVRPGESVGYPLLYAIVMGYVNLAAGLLWFSLQAGAQLALLQSMAERAGEAFPAGAMAGASLLVIAAAGLVLVPLGVVLGLAIWTLVVHLFLLLFGGAGRGLVGTFRTLAYASTAQLAGLIPFCGGVLSALWGLVLQIIGLARVHDTTELRAAGAILAPVVVCCLCVVALIAFGVVGPLLAQAGGR